MTTTILALFLASFALADDRTAVLAAREDKPQVAPPADPVVAPGSARAWILLAPSVLFERNEERHDLLAGGPLDEKWAAEMKKRLVDDWEILTKADLKDALLGLELDGHRKSMMLAMGGVTGLSPKELEKKLAKLEKPEERLKVETYAKHAARVTKHKAGMLAWDYSRAIALCRWGYASGLLEESEAWELAAKFAQELQKSYGSWAEVGEFYAIGRELWRPGEAEATWKAFEKLRDGEKSPWKTVAWNTKLVLDKKKKSGAQPKNP